MNQPTVWVGFSEQRRRASIRKDLNEPTHCRGWISAAAKAASIEQSEPTNAVGDFVFDQPASWSSPAVNLLAIFLDNHRERSRLEVRRSKFRLECREKNNSERRAAQQITANIQLSVQEGFRGKGPTSRTNATSGRC